MDVVDEMSALLKSLDITFITVVVFANPDSSAYGMGSFPVIPKQEPNKIVH